MAEADWKIRVRLEHADLVGRMEKLRAFLATNMDGLQDEDKRLLHQQLDVMTEYSDILCRRITRFPFLA